MSIPAHLFTSLVARDFQPRIGFGSAFLRPRFDASWPVADGELSDEAEQGGRIGSEIDAMRGPLGPPLYGVFEAQLPRVKAGLECGLRHQQTDQVIGEQMDPQFLLDHLRGEAAQDVHSERDFDVAKIQLHMPASRVQLVQLAFSDLARIDRKSTRLNSSHANISYAVFC